MDVSLFTPGIITFVISALLGSLVLHLFPKWGLMDNPKKYGHDRAPIPLPGGIAPVLAFLIAILLFFPKDISFLGLFASVALLAAVSFWDDRKPLSPFFRLGVHFLAAGIAVSSGIKIEFLGNPFGEAFHLEELFPLLPELITVIWLVGFANVMNWLDGVPGLSAASASAAGIFLGILSLTPLVAQPEIAKLSFALAGAAIGFLIFNFPPPKMLLGDTGAMSFGFLLAVLSVFHGGKVATAFVVLAIPMLDTAYVILRRILKRKNPFEGKDKLHLHDKLHELGLSHREILVFFLIISISLGWLSLQLQSFGKAMLILGVGVSFLLFSWGVEKYLEKK